MAQTASQARAFVRLLHPFPSVLVALTAAAMTGLSAGEDGWYRAGVAGVAMLFAQFSVGVVNDLCDTELDTSTKPWKPIVSGRVSPLDARLLAATLMALAGGLALVLGARAAAALLLITYLLNLYNMKLKSTRLSWLPFALFFPLIALYSEAASGVPVTRAEVTVPLGALLGVSVHLANSIPDIDGDARHGAGGLADWLGPGRALVLGWALLGLAQLLALMAGLATDARLSALLSAEALSVALLVAAIDAVRRRVTHGLQDNFALVAFSAMALGIGWIGACR